ncbi:hypothetical protein B0T16DRAFT_417296 [Cercophora newfieldiana]|uniref:Uncharacterized protein n=1 Tax=Cercophora newfieldiana TaxID=92897 RepID=A0AA39Y468_9PEZI|nr:hypothetical protein B0T16DRAFT_417296 [Cercophora newfieldiana]
MSHFQSGPIQESAPNSGASQSSDYLSEAFNVGSIKTAAQLRGWLALTLVPGCQKTENPPRLELGLASSAPFQRPTHRSGCEKGGPRHWVSTASAARSSGVVGYHVSLTH